MARTKFIAGNWKLNLTSAEGVALIDALKKSLPSSVQAGTVEVAVCPTALSVESVVKAAAGSRIGVGAQNVYWEDKGAFTGEISASVVKAIGASYVILGHSERRQYFGETDATINKRLKAVLAQNLVPIVCIGETLAERNAGSLQQVLSTQITGALAGFTAAQLSSLVIAYEPVWAIGTGVVATTAQVQEAHVFVRSVLRTVVGAVADGLRIQYGGSVKADNAKEILGLPDVDGALVGGASLKAADFTAIIAAA